MAIHFGVNIREGTRGLKLTRGNYAIVSNKSSFEQSFMEYTDEWCIKHLDDCLKNYDLNKEYFSLLNHDEFNAEIDEFLQNNQYFAEVYDLNLYVRKSGYYILILDEYCQLYIGTSNDIKRRIMQHWSRSMPFDRLLFGGVDTSILSIDSFRTLDTTRIFAFITEETFNLEDRFINKFSPKFVCNRITGGKINGGLNQAISMMKTRQLE